MDKRDIERIIAFVWRRDGLERVLAATWGDLAGRIELRGRVRAAVAPLMGDEFDDAAAEVDRQIAIQVPARRFLVAEETSGGTIIGQIEIADRLVWSHIYDDDQQVIADALHGSEYADFEGGEIDEDGNPVDFINSTHSAVILASYDADTASWDTEWPERFGARGADFLVALNARIN